MENTVPPPIGLFSPLRGIYDVASMILYVATVFKILSLNKNRYTAMYNRLNRAVLLQVDQLSIMLFKTSDEQA